MAKQAKITHHLKKILVELNMTDPSTYIAKVDLVIQTLISHHKEYEFDNAVVLHTSVTDVLTTMVYTYTLSIYLHRSNLSASPVVTILSVHT